MKQLSKLLIFFAASNMLVSNIQAQCTPPKIIINGGITICNQVWMTQNLDVTTYRNGDPIPQVTDPAAWANLTTGAWCYFRNSTDPYYTKYGRLYNWYAVNDPRGLAPLGWHIPTDAELTELVLCVDPSAATDIIGAQSTIAGNKLKSTTGWLNGQNIDISNSSGFTALPGGFRDQWGYDQEFSTEGKWWSTTEGSPTEAYFRYLESYSNNIYRRLPYKVLGASVRCIRDYIPICNGTNVTLTASGASTYTWSPATGLNTTSGATVIASPNTTTTYTVTGTDANGCTSTASVTVTPNCGISCPSINITSQDVCLNGSYTFSQTGGQAGGTWSVSGGGTINPSSGLFTSNAAGTGFRVTYTPPQTTACFASALFNVNALPVPAVVVSQPTCQQTTGVVTVTSPTGSGITYTLTPINPSGTALTKTGNNIEFTGLAPGSYTLRYTDAAGCQSTALSITINSPVNSAAAPVTIITQPTCQSVTGTISVTSPTGAGIEYTLTPVTPSGTPVTQTGTTFSGLNPGNYSLAYTNNGCSSASAAITITGVPGSLAAPTVTVTQPGCQGESGTILVTAPTGGTSGNKITNYSVVGSGSAINYYNDPRSLNWNNGTPTTSGSNTAGIYISGIGNGFQLTAPADNQVRTLKVYVGGWNSGGTFTATLSDGSATTYTNSSYSASGQYNAVYSVSYNAATAGKLLTIKWIQGSGGGNVTLQAATLSESAITNVTGTLSGSSTNSSATVNLSAEGTADWAHWPGFDHKSATGSNITYILTPVNPSGSPVTQTGTLFANLAPGDYSITATGSGCASQATPVTINSGTGPGQMPTADVTQPTCQSQTGMITVTSPTGAGIIYSLTNTVTPGSPVTQTGTTFNGLTPGTYTLRYNNNGGCSSAPLSIVINTPSGTGAAPTVQITQPGCQGETGTIVITAPSGVTNGNRISNYGVVGSGSVGSYSNDLLTYTWSDGTPTVSGSDKTGINIWGIGNGFQLTAPADLLSRTLKVYVGGWNSGGMFTAHLSDGSSPDYVNTSFSGTGIYIAVYTITYKAASAGQLLTVKWVLASGAGNISLQAATLTESVTGTPPSLSGNGVIPTTAANLTTEGTADWAHWPGFNHKAPVGSSLTFTLTPVSPAGPAVTQSGNIFAGLLPGDYSITAIGNGCSSQATPVTINQGTASGPPPTATITQPTCTTPTGTLIVNSPVSAGISYTLTKVSPSGPPVTQTGTTFAGLIPGSYALRYSSSGGCPSAALTVVISTPAGTGAAPTVQVTQPTCAAPTGTIVVSAPTGVSGGNKLTNYTVVGSGSVYNYYNDPRSLNWNNGTPTANGSNAAGIYISGIGNGFQVTAPADNQVRTLKVYVGGWNSGGTFTATLSDGSAPSYSNSSYAGSGQYNAVYTVTYNAASAGKLLTVKWVQGSGGGNVTLQAATLTESATNNAAGTLIGSSTGSSAIVNLSAEGTADWAHWPGFDHKASTSSYSYTLTPVSPLGPSVTQPGTIFAGLAPGDYTVSASDGGCSTQAANVTINTPVSTSAPGVSVLNISCGMTTGTIVVTSPATTGNRISNYAVVGSGSATNYYNDPRSLNWNNGTPTASGSNAAGIYISGIGNGFQVSAPADNQVRTLKVYVGGWNSGGTFTATLSDGSAATYTNASYSGSGQYNAVYTVTYNAAGANKLLTVKWVQGSGGGNVTLQAATLTESATTNITGSLSGISTGSSATVNLSAEGTADWAHWPGFDHKATTGGSISYTVTPVNPAGTPVTQTGNVFPGLPPGEYDVSASANGCLTTKLRVTIYQSVCRGEELVADPKLKAVKEPFAMTVQAFPNPSGNFFTLRTNSTSKEIMTVRIVDVMGRVVLVTKILPGQPYRFGDRFFAGTYLLEVVQQNHRQMITVIKTD